MNCNFYLIINNNGTTRTAKKPPDLDWNEIAIYMTMKLPDMLFQKPLLKASVNIDQAKVSIPEIEAKMVTDIQDAIKSVTGIDVQLELVHPPSNEDQKKS